MGEGGEGAFPLAGKVEPIKPNLTMAKIRSEVVSATLQRNPSTDVTSVERSLRLFHTRTLVDDALKAKARENRNDSWAVDRGQYSSLDSDMKWRMGKDKLDEPLEGIELLIDQQIAELVSGREADGTILQKPVTLVDFGGGRGLSMIRLAAKWKEQILAGKVVMAVTNLAYLPDPAIDADGYTGIARAFNNDKNNREPIHWPKPALDFIQANQELVDYVEADAGELIGKTIPSAKGKPVNLAGGIDILHESRVLEHPHTPDVALAVLSKCLSPEGTFFMNATAMNPNDLYKPVNTAEGLIDITTPEYEAARENALIVGKEILKASGLQQVQDTTPSRRLYYQVFTKPQAPNYSLMRSKVA